MRLAAAAATLLVAVAVLLVSPVRTAGGGAHPSDRHPPPLRSSDMLRAAGGSLWWADGCHLMRLRMRDLRRTTVPGLHCRAWPSPDGATVLATADGPSPSFGPPPRLAVLHGPTLARTQLTALRADELLAPATWSPDGQVVAFCYAGRSGVEVVALVAPWRSPAVTPGRCHPSYTVASTQLTTDGTAIYENGGRLPLESVLSQAAGNPVDGYEVTALSATRDGLVAAVQGRLEHGVGGLAAVVSIDRRSGGSSTVASGSGATELGVAPDGRSFWYRERRDRLVQLVVPDQNSNPADPAVAAGVPALARAFAWSPDGRYLAVARADEIRVYDRRTGTTGSITGVDADQLSWTR